MKRLVLVILLSLLAASGSAVAAEPGPQFKLGFKLLADQIPDVVGIPIEEEHYAPNGDSHQRTTTGLMVWRKADNRTAFTNGVTTWISTADGVQSRPNGEPFPWETTDPNPPPAEPPSQLAALQPSRTVAPVASAAGAPRFGIGEAFRQDSSTQIRMSWERIIFSWAAIQPNGPADWRADLYFRPETLRQELSRGREIVGLLQFTPTWAASNPADGQRSVPRNISFPFDSPENYWARFAGRIAGHYRGQIDRWIIWNEPEFKPGDRGSGQSFTWLGSDEQYLDLLKSGYQAIKAANPNATVIFGATSYWVDINMGREPFFKRLLKLGAGSFFDAVAFNIYWAPDDLLRVYTEMREAMRARGIDKPIWLTETNAMPYDDPATPKTPNGQRVTMSVQADYAIQALAIASAAGYERVGWYNMVDGGVWREQEVWGLLRDNGSARPVFDAIRTAVDLFTGARRATFVPLERENQPFGTPWPIDPNSYYPNWLVYQVVFDHPDGRRVTVLWNADSSPLRVRVPKLGSSAVLVDKTGAQRPISDMSGWYLVDLAPATVKGPLDPDGYHYIGGAPALLVEQGVPPEAPVQEPRLGDPGSIKPGLQLSLDPPAQKFTPGQTVRFTLRLRSIEGFSSAVQLSVPNLPSGASIEMPTTALPGERVPIIVRSDPSLEPNLYVLSLKADGGGVSTATDLVLEVPAS